MSQFYFLLWLQWALRVSVSSVLFAIFFSSIVTLFIYIKQGSVELSSEVIKALVEVFLFWFPLVWSVALLVALFRSLKYIFNKCVAGYELKLLECNKSDVIEVVGYGDLVKVWRRWFMLMIWLTGVQMIVVSGLMYILDTNSSIFDWFSIYILYLFILLSGYVSFILLGGRCKKVKVKKC